MNHRSVADGTYNTVLQIFPASKGSTKLLEMKEDYRPLHFYGKISAERSWCMSVTKSPYPMPVVAVSVPYGMW